MLLRVLHSYVKLDWCMTRIPLTNVTALELDQPLKYPWRSVAPPYLLIEPSNKGEFDLGLLKSTQKCLGGQTGFCTEMRVHVLDPLRLIGVT